MNGHRGKLAVGLGIGLGALTLVAGGVFTGVWISRWGP